MVKFINRCKVQVVSGGTGSLTFGAAVSSFESLADQSVGAADQLRYALEQGNEYEIGTGVIGLSGSTYSMSRTPIKSSNSDNSAINAGGSAVCFFTMLADDVAQYLADLANVSATAPASGQTLTWDSVASQWKPASPSGGIVNVSTFANLPASPGVTDLAFVSDKKALYIYDGTEWDRIYTDTNAVPDWTTEPPATVTNLSTDGTATTQTVAATDPEGFPVEFTFDTNPSNQAQATVANSGGAFTITPSTVQTNAGEFILRYKASDGLHSTSRSTTYRLSFFPQTANLWGHWDMSNSASYSGTGTAWNDLSGNGRNLTWVNVTGSAGYVASGNVGVPVWETGNRKSYFDLTIDSTVKTIMFIFDPLQHPVNDNFVQIFMSSGLNTYAGAFSTSNSNITSMSAQSGLTAEQLVNGNSNLIISAAQAAVEENKLNSFFLKNYNAATAWRFFYYGASGYNENIQVKAIAMWDVTLTAAEMQIAHESYSQMATWDG